jgi:hypothetical protein
MQRSHWRMCLVLTGLAATLGLASCGSSSGSSATCAGSSFAGTLKYRGATIATFTGTACWSQRANDWALGLTTTIPLLCSDNSGQTTFPQLDVTAFVATEGAVTLIP